MSHSPISVFYASPSLSFQFTSPDYRSLDVIGYPNFVVDIYGNVRNVLTGKTLTVTYPNGRSPYVQVPYPAEFGLPIPVATLRVESCVGEAWWNEAPSEWQNSPYIASILWHRYFYSIPLTHRRKITFDVCPNTFYWITRYGVIFAHGTKKQLATFFKSSGVMCFRFPMGEYNVWDIVKIAFAYPPSELNCVNIPTNPGNRYGLIPELLPEEY